MPIFNLGQGSSQTWDILPNGKRKSWIRKFLELAKQETYRICRKNLWYALYISISLMPSKTGGGL